MMRMILLAPLAFVAMPALAGSFTPPEGCTAYLTLQSRGCHVANYYRCTGDAPGDQWRADFDQEGVFYYSRIDSETQWVESIDLNPTVVQRLDPAPADPASFSELLATGYDSFAFGLSRDDGRHTKVHGHDKLTGQSMVIDGVTLQQTEFDYTETDDAGTVLRRARGNEFIHPEWRMFFSGRSEWDRGDGSWLPLDGSPVQFIMPGEPGFAATQPIFDCDVVTSQDEGAQIVPVAVRP